MVPTLKLITSRLRLKHMQLLIALDDYGSLHKAAQDISISQPGATKSLHEIEDVLDMQLFERNPKGIEPNEVGRCVIRYARLVYSDLAHMREEIVGIMQGHGGHIAIGTTMGAVPSLTKAIRNLRLAQPALSIEIFEDTSANLLKLLDKGRIDLAICRSHVGQKSAAYDSLELSDEPLAVVANKKNPLANTNHLKLKDLIDYSWIVYPSNMPMRQSLEYEINRAGLEVIQYPIETSSTFTTLMLLQQDPTLVAVIPEEVAKFCVSTNILSQLDVRIPSLMGPYGVVRRTGAHLPSGAHLIIRELFKIAGKNHTVMHWDD